MELHWKKNIVKKGNIFNNLGKNAKKYYKKGAEKPAKKYLKENKKKMLKNITKKNVLA